MKNGLGGVSRVTRYAVDERVPELQAEMTMTAPREDPVRFTAVLTDYGSFLTSPAWKGSRQGEWLKVGDDENAGLAGQVGGPSSITTVPVGAGTFTPTRVRQVGRVALVDGTVAALDGLQAVGLNAMLKDSTFAESLSGDWPAQARIEDGRLLGLDVMGDGSTVSAVHAKYSAEQLAGIFGAAKGTVTVESIGAPVTLVRPDLSRLIKAS